MANFLGNTSMPNYVKLTATAILATTYFAALYVATSDMTTNTAVPSVVSFILGTGLSMALGALGIHQGATLMESGPTPVPTSKSSTTTVTTTTGGTPDASTPTA